MGQRGKGQMMIDFADLDSLDGIIAENPWPINNMNILTLPGLYNSGPDTGKVYGSSTASAERDAA
jgi:hypothetical protein